MITKKALKIRTGKDAPNYKHDDNIKVNSIHRWLNITYGKPEKCDGTDCSGKTNIHEWCKLPNKKHERKRDNYIRLCRSCHRKLDKIYPPSRKGVKLTAKEIEQRRTDAYLRKRGDGGQFVSGTIIELTKS